LTAYDKRLHAFRPDLADARLKGEVSADRFVAGMPARIVAPVADMLGAPRPDAGLNTQLLRGDDVTLFEETEGWAWVQAERDGYVGYVSGGSLGQRDGVPTHVVSAPRSFLYPGPDLKLPRLGELSLGSQVTVRDFAETRGTRYALLSTGEAMISGHLRPVCEVSDDYVAVAEQLLMTPYLWGGSTAFGIDCSGLVQLALLAVGRPAPRDSDMQAALIGAALDGGAPLERGDLVFWKGHVGIMRDPTTLLHANAWHMAVVAEPLAEAARRTAAMGGGGMLVRRRP
jgi:cell wall-associated NlpC family hydrolase